LELAIFILKTMIVDLSDGPIQALHTNFFDLPEPESLVLVLKFLFMTETF